MKPQHFPAQRLKHYPHSSLGAAYMTLQYSTLQFIILDCQHGPYLESIALLGLINDT